MSRTSALLRVVALLLLPLLPGCGLIVRECYPFGCPSPLIVKNESNQVLRACKTENTSSCREIALGASLEIGDFANIRVDGEWIPPTERPWLIICNRAVRVNQLGATEAMRPQRINEDAVVIVSQQMTERFCGN